MSAAHRYLSCACCGRPLCENDRVSVEPLIEANAPIRYIPVLWDHSTFPPAERRTSHGSGTA